MGDPIVMASDHRGARLKAALRERLESEGWETRDFGPDGEDAVDYPDFVVPAARAVSDGEAARGIVICGSPDTVRDRLEYCQREAGVGTFLGMFQVASMPHEMTVASMKRFAEEVMPRVASAS